MLKLLATVLKSIVKPRVVVGDVKNHRQCTCGALLRFKEGTYNDRFYKNRL